MALKDNEKFNSLKKSVNAEYESIINDSKLDLEYKSNKIANLLKTDNTNENIVLEYLNLMDKILAKSKDDSIKKIILQYECCIEEKKFNQTFQPKKITKISYKKRIMNLISLIKEYEKKELDDKIKLLDKIESENIVKFHNTFPINYNSNLELYFYSLYEALCNKIMNFFKINYIDKKDIEMHLMKLIIEKNKLLFNNEMENSEKIMVIDNKIKYFPFIYGTFNKYISAFSNFIDSTYDNFYKRFASDHLKDEKELLLFTDYIFFLSYYSFVKYNDDDYINIWNDTLIDITIEEKINIIKTSSARRFTFTIENNNLEVKDKSKKIKDYSIPNIEDYSFEILINYLYIIKHKPDLIELNRFLKIDKYYENLYIRKIWKIWEEFLIKVLSSNMVESVFNKIFDDIKDKNDGNKLSPQSFFDKEEIKLIINNTRYFIFKSDFYGITVGKNLLIYLNGDPFLVDGDPLQNKIFFLSYDVKSNLHEIVGHLNIRFQYYISKDKRYILSPKPKNPSSQAKSRGGKEAGEFIEELIFGTSEQKITIEQMLYILDIKNYEKDYINFRNGFIKCGEMKGYEISEEFKIFLSQLDIDSKNITFESNSSFCLIEMHKNETGFYRIGKHPMEGYNDIYEE